jgi:hypothetical protein
LNADSARDAHGSIGSGIGTSADLLLDCDLGAHREAIGRAKMST